MLEAIMLLSWWWIAAIIIFSIASFGCLLAEEGTYSTLFLITLVGILIYCTPDVFVFITTSPGLFALYVVLYISIGFIWSFFRWYKFLLQEKARGAKSVIAKYYKSDFAFWITYWPISVLKYLIGDFIYDLFSRFWGIFGKTYQKIADKVLEV